MQNCAQCQSQFKITSEDEKFYKKFGHKPAGLCFECDQKNRLCFRNERKLYRRKCDKTGRSIVSIYSPDKPYTVYANDVWYGNDWNALSYGRDFDFSHPFFQQFKELQLQVPRPPLVNINSENSDYCNMCGGNKNCYLVFGGDYNQDVLYGTLCMRNMNSIDLDFSNHNELCYMLGDTIGSYGCQYVFDSKNCKNCYFISDCSNCSECILCTNLNNKSYYIENKQLSKNEYLQKKENLINGSFIGNKKLWQKLVELRQNRIVKFSHIVNCENCSGDYLKNSKNCHNCFDTSDSEDTRNIIFGAKAKNSFNSSLIGHDAEFVFSSISVLTGRNLQFCYYIWDSADVTYSECIFNSANCFGCIGLDHKKYCILNKQYSKEEYEALIPRIIGHLKSTGEWGHFLSKDLSCFGYNETTAHEYYPMTKNDAVSQGFKWSDIREEPPKAEKIIPADRLPDSIKEIPDDILNWAIKCGKSSHPFKITEAELKFYRRNNIPIPHECSECRHKLRSDLRNPKKLYERECAKCGSAIKTTYAPDRPEMIYCETCYLKTVY